MTTQALIRNSRDGGEFQPIGMEEALRTATMWLSPIIHQKSPESHGLTLCVGRHTDFQLACDWASNAGTDNVFADRALSAANAPPMRDKNKVTKLVLAFGSSMGRGAETTQQQLAELRNNGAKIISLNPVKTGLSALADQWFCIRPGSDEAVLQVLTGQRPCNYEQLADTGLSVLDMERLVREVNEHKGQIAIIAGKGVFSHRNGSQISALLATLDADILSAADNAYAARNISTLLNDNCEALLCVGSGFPWHSQTSKALQAFEGRIICLSDDVAGYETCADLVFRGTAEENLITLGARTGLEGFSDVEGNSPFVNGYADYRSMEAELKPVSFDNASPTETKQDEQFPYHAVNQKGHEGANRKVVVMNTNKASFLGLSKKDIVWVKSATGKTKAMLVLMDDMNENTVWSWGADLFNPLMPEEELLRDETTGQPAWFDLKVSIEKCVSEE